MTPTEFCYWLQGCFELGALQTMDANQIACLRKHLDLVFAHSIDLKAGGPEHQKMLNAIHDNEHLTQGNVPGTVRPRC